MEDYTEDQITRLPEAGSVRTKRSSRRVRARTARLQGTSQEIRPGDLVEVTEGFHYEDGGRRLGYFRRYRRPEKGPQWPVRNNNPQTEVLNDECPF
jgi:hypothetical protein